MGFGNIFGSERYGWDQQPITTTVSVDAIGIGVLTVVAQKDRPDFTITKCVLPSMESDFTINNYYCLKNRFQNLAKVNNPLATPFVLASAILNLREQVNTHVSGSLD